MFRYIATFFKYTLIITTCKVEIIHLLQIKNLRSTDHVSVRGRSSTRIKGSQFTASALYTIPLSFCKLDEAALLGRELLPELQDWPV